MAGIFTRLDGPAPVPRDFKQLFMTCGLAWEKGSGTLRDSRSLKLPRTRGWMLWCLAHLATIASVFPFTWFSAPVERSGKQNGISQTSMSGGL